ncbi:Hypothetical_protein [Hexamita inflata]|uniref:Hypothetical_protein n=1 Tax=Hexamita inflata TaxID=28002 RepID=A0AA86PWJ7_9EUKA|nr:Hypothetical protein HINF_LOCUS30258 [Hexamita inflata]CAI9942620.1 Hypothetical protein HINF_LOCUS30265 [Hexamita inflata]CAI9961870.1 Hypothetical protein HINF_LOCUS49515 [Hexamita inflata]
MKVENKSSKPHCELLFHSGVSFNALSEFDVVKGCVFVLVGVLDGSLHEHFQLLVLYVVSHALLQDVVELVLVNLPVVVSVVHPEQEPELLFLGGLVTEYGQILDERLEADALVVALVHKQLGDPAGKRVELELRDLLKLALHDELGVSGKLVESVKACFSLTSTYTVLHCIDDEQGMQEFILAITKQS